MEIRQQYLTGERALYNTHNATIIDTTFDNGESPLKESSDLKIYNSIFKWKYPLWYSKNVYLKNTSLIELARSGIWYTTNVTFEDSTIAVPKTFRRSKDITLKNTTLPVAEETFWMCEGINLENVSSNGNYFMMNSHNILINGFNHNGNYLLDGAKNVEIHSARIISKDAFWNCENVVVYDSTIIGEYLGWNSKNIKFVNCTIDSLQGMCYMDGIVMENCKLLNTNLSFEYSKVDATIDSKIDSVKNPISGRIKAKGIGEIILDEDLIDPNKTKIEVL
jgi:hypothetical protein